MNQLKRVISLLFCFILLAGVLTGCNGNTDNDLSETKSLDPANAKIGIVTGSSHDSTVKKMFPNAQRVYFKSLSDMILAVEQEKIDCYIEDEPFLAATVWEGSDVKSLPDSIGYVYNGFVFPKTEESKPLQEQVNAFLKQAKEDGTLDRLWEKWMADTEPLEHPDYQSLTGENGTIRLAVCLDNKPLLYKYKDGCTGLEMEILTLFAQEYGYSLKMEEVPFDSILVGIAAGKYDMASSALTITAERQESVDFSEPYAGFDVVMVVKDEEKRQSTGKTLADFTHANIGILTGSVYDDYTKEMFPEAERSYYTLMSDLILAVDQEKIDGYMTENIYVAAAQWEGAKIESLAETLDQTHAGFIFRKDDPGSLVLRTQLNDFIAEAKQSGLLAQLNEKWFGAAEPEEHPDFDALTGENGTLQIAAATDLKPVSYLKNGKLSGYEMELMWLFAQEYGYKLNIATVTFDAILPGITTGKYDIGTGAITITEERAQSVDFSDSHLTVDVVLVVKQEESVAQNSFWAEIKEDIHKTFLREDRWKLILEGIGVTMLISICAIAAGTLLGFGLYMLSRSDIKWIQILTKGIAKVYSRIVAGTPVVVILMILFYVVFGNFRDMSGVLVAIIGFTLTFAVFVYDHMIVSVGSVDNGQMEAAYALGYPKNKAFFRIILPQAMTIFLPSYCGQAVDLVKATAVVGYIAVNDLTKMGDIIRSNTYEAFFPLIATAVIYFLLTWILSLLLGFVKRCFEPKRRSSAAILKGVKNL